MCGIVAYTGNQPAKEILIEGLKRLEYRGYDSSGIFIAKARPILPARSARWPNSNARCGIRLPQAWQESPTPAGPRTASPAY